MAKQSAFQSPYLVVPFKYGMVGGILSIILFLVLYWAGINPLIKGIFFSFFFIPIFIFFSVKEFKKYYNAGFLHFWQGMSIGFITYMIIALVSATFIWIYLDSINTELLREYITDRVGLMDSSRENLVEQLGKDSFEQALSAVKLTTALDMALDDFIRKVAIGFFITTVISVVMRQQPLTEKNKQS